MKPATYLKKAKAMPDSDAKLMAVFRAVLKALPHTATWREGKREADRLIRAGYVFYIRQTQKQPRAGGGKTAGKNKNKRRRKHANNPQNY